MHMLPFPAEIRVEMLTMRVMLMTEWSRVLRAALMGTINWGTTGKIFPSPACNFSLQSYHCHTSNLGYIRWNHMRHWFKLLLIIWSEVTLNYESPLLTSCTPSANNQHLLSLNHLQVSATNPEAIDLDEMQNACISWISTGELAWEREGIKP
jgi:hypothetical protein